MRDSLPGLLRGKQGKLGCKLGSLVNISCFCLDCMSGYSQHLRVNLDSWGLSVNSSSAGFAACIEVKRNATVTLENSSDSMDCTLWSLENMTVSSASNEVLSSWDSMVNRAAFVAYNLDSKDCSLESLMKTVANEMNSLDLRANNSDSLASRPAMSGCMMVTSASMDSSVNTKLSRPDLLPDTSDSSGCMKGTMESKTSSESSLVKSDCNLAMLASSEVTSASRLCLWDCKMDLSANMMDLPMLQADSLDWSVNMTVKLMVNVGSKVTFLQVSLEIQDSVTSLATFQKRPIELTARSWVHQVSFH